jgi:hypothetical protein
LFEEIELAKSAEMLDLMEKTVALVSAENLKDFLAFALNFSVEWEECENEENYNNLEGGKCEKKLLLQLLDAVEIFLETEV